MSGNLSDLDSAHALLFASRLWPKPHKAIAPREKSAIVTLFERADCTPTSHKYTPACSKHPVGIVFVVLFAFRGCGARSHVRATLLRAKARAQSSSLPVRQRDDHDTLLTDSGGPGDTVTSWYTNLEPSVKLGSPACGTRPYFLGEGATITCMKWLKYVFAVSYVSKLRCGLARCAVRGRTQPGKLGACTHSLLLQTARCSKCT